MQVDVRDMNSIPGWERSPGRGHGNPLQSFCLENSHGQRRQVGYSLWGHRVGHDWSDLAHMHAQNGFEMATIVDGWLIKGSLCYWLLKNHIPPKSHFEMILWCLVSVQMALHPRTLYKALQNTTEGSSFAFLQHLNIE